MLLTRPLTWYQDWISERRHKAVSTVYLMDGLFVIILLITYDQ